MSGSKESLFNELLVHLSSRIGSEELEAMKFMMKPTEDDKASIPNRTLYQITTPLALFDEMTKKDIISPDNVDKLKDMVRLCTGDNHVLRDIIRKYEQAQSGDSVLFGGKRLLEDRSPGQIGEDLKNSHAFEIVIRSIGKNWRQLARALRFNNSDIEAIEEKYPQQLREQSREMLEQWVDMHYGRVRQVDLVAALRRCDLNMMAHNVESCSTYYK